MTLAWHEEPIGKQHERASFDCGNIALNGFLHRHARKSHERGSAKTFLAIDNTDGKTVLGYYSVSPASIAYARTPSIITRGLARHDVPVFLLARLAVRRSVQGQGLGGQLLLAAGRRCLLVAAQAGGVALLIDAKDEPAAHWYASYGALPRCWIRPIHCYCPSRQSKLLLWQWASSEDPKEVSDNAIPSALLASALAFQGGLRCVGAGVGGRAYLSALTNPAPFSDQAPGPEQVGLHIQPVVAIEIAGRITANEGHAGHAVSR